MTSWIDGSFVYSTSETWVNAMRSFQNGTFKTGISPDMPPLNLERVPMFTAMAPHLMRFTNPELIFCKFLHIHIQNSKIHKGNCNHLSTG